MSEPKPRIYWDTSVWCEWVRNQEGDQALCTALLQEAEARRLEIVVSPLVVSEFAPSDPEAETMFLQHLQRSSFVRVALSWHRAAEARDLVRSHPGLGGPDAAHLACAIYAKAGFFHTYDGNQTRGLLGRAAEFPQIAICRPDWPGQARLVWEEGAR